MIFPGPFGSLSLRLEIPTEARAGATIPITLRVENTGDQPIELYLRGRTIPFDVVVRRPDGADVWRRLDTEIIPAFLQLRVLEPHEALELRTTWNQRLRDGSFAAPGAYVLQGLLLTDGPDSLATRLSRCASEHSDPHRG